MEAALDATPRPLTDAYARMCGRYLREEGTFALLVAAAALAAWRSSSWPPSSAPAVGRQCK